MFLAPADLVAEGCSAQVDGQLMHEDTTEVRTRYSFKVDVRAEEECAEVHFELIIEEETGTEVKTNRVFHQVKLHNGSTSQKIDYDIPSEHRLVRWEVKMTECKICDGRT